MASPYPALRPPLGWPRQRLGHALAARRGDPSGVNLERTRCSVPPARAVATGQDGELARRVVIQMSAVPPVENPVLLDDEQRGPEKHGQPQVGMDTPVRAGCRASSLPRWLDGTWIFRLAGIEYDYYAHYDEPILEDRPSASRQLQLRTH